jgi:hypothetical protein
MPRLFDKQGSPAPRLHGVFISVLPMATPPAK